MKRIFMIAALLLTLLLAACQSAGTPAAATPATTDYPAPDLNGVAPTSYPQPGASVSDPASAYPVLPGDENKAAGSFFADRYELRANASDAAQTDLFTSGSLPTPCNEIRAFVNPPNENREIFVQVYSVADKDKVCTQVLQPFEGSVTTLTGFSAGKYTVYANNQLVGEVTLP